MEYLQSTNDYEYRRKKAFQSITDGTVTKLMLLLDGLDSEVRTKLLHSRSDRVITLRRPSTARHFRIKNPTLLASACAEWYMEIVEFLAEQNEGKDETVDVLDESNDIVEYTGVSPLCIATITGKYKMVQILIEHGADMNQQNSIGNTALFEACFEGHVSIVSHLVHRGANIELTNHKNVTCLMIASYNNNLEIVKLLTDLGANVHKKDKIGRNALFYCIESGSLPIFKLLSESGATTLTDDRGMTVLMEAAYYGQHDMVKWMAKNRDRLNLNLNAFDKKGRNVLFYCAEVGNVDVFQSLLTYGVAIHPANDGSTVLMTAALRGKHRMVEYFHENVDQLGLGLNAKDKIGRNCLFYCVSGGDIPLFEKMIKFGAAVHCAGNGLSLLHQAAVRGYDNFCTYLLDHSEDLGLDIQGHDQDGWNALFFAVAGGNLPLFKLLFEKGVNAEVANDGRTLLMEAAQRGNLETLRHILGSQKLYKSAINDCDNQGRSALYTCLQSKTFQDGFRFLLERGAVLNHTYKNSNIFMETVLVAKNVEPLKMLVKQADVLKLDINDVDTDGRNALFYVAQNGSEAIMEYLLQRSFTFLSDKDGKTVLMTAAERGHQKLIDLLVQRHRELFLDLEHKDEQGRNVLFYALESENLECFRTLIEAGVTCESDNSGRTILMLLAGKKAKHLLDFVLTTRTSLGVDLHSKDAKGDSAIHYAVRSKQYENLLSLVQNGADLVLDGQGGSVVSQCVDEGDFWVVEALATNGIDLSEDLNRKDSHGIPYFHHLLYSGMDDALMIALLEMYYDETNDHDSDGLTMTMKLVAKEGAVLKHLVEGICVDLNKVDNKGRNVLQHCAFSNNLDNLKYFLAYGAQFKKDNDMKTALMESSQGCQDNTDCLRHLLKYIYRTDDSKRAVDCRGKNALHYCILSGNTQGARVLLDNGIEINSKDKEGMTPFLLSATCNHPELVHLFAKSGADVNDRTDQSQNALHLVFENEGSFAMTQALIGRGCEVNARDGSGRTPLMLAARKDNMRPIKCLLENGADASLVDGEGRDALSYCPESHHIIRVLLTKHKDTSPRKRIDFADSRPLTQHLLNQIDSENVSNRNTGLTRCLDRVVSGVLSREPGAFDNLCNALKNTTDNPFASLDGCQEFYV